MLVLKEPAKQTRDIFLAREMTAIKNIQSFSRKKLTASNVKFLQLLSFVVRNIWDGWSWILEVNRSLMIASSSSSFTHTIRTYNTTFEHSDEIRIPIHNSRIYTRYHVKILYVEGKLISKEENVQNRPKLGCNCVVFMFDEIRYVLNGMEINRSRNVGMTNLMKGMQHFLMKLHIACIMRDFSTLMIPRKV